MKLSTKNSIRGGLKKTLVVILVVGAIGAAGNYSKDQPTKATGYVMSKDAFLPSCVSGATEGNNPMDSVTATNYCGCVYDTGVKQYGGEGFTQKLTELGQTNHVTPELSDIINGCLAGRTSI